MSTRPGKAMDRFQRARRMGDGRRIAGRDEGEEAAGQALAELMDQHDVEPAEVLALLLEDHPAESYEALGSMASDRERGKRAWARDRLERRRMGRDQPPLPGEPPAEIEDFTKERGMGSMDRRRFAGDMAYDSARRGSALDRLFDNARRIERL